MQILDRSHVLGNHVELQTTEKAHISDKETVSLSKGAVPSFANVLVNAVEQVNGNQIKSGQLEQELVLHPDEVNVHEVMIASEKARLSLALMKSVTEKALKAYNDIMMIR